MVCKAWLFNSLQITTIYYHIKCPTRKVEKFGGEKKMKEIANKFYKVKPWHSVGFIHWYSELTRGNLPLWSFSIVCFWIGRCYPLDVIFFYLIFFAKWIFFFCKFSWFYSCSFEPRNSILNPIHQILPYQNKFSYLCIVCRFFYWYYSLKLHFIQPPICRVFGFSVKYMILEFKLVSALVKYLKACFILFIHTKSK